MGHSGRSSHHWASALEGDSGTSAPPLPTSRGAASLEAQTNRAKWPWAEISKVMSQNKPFLYTSSFPHILFMMLTLIHMYMQNGDRVMYVNYISLKVTKKTFNVTAFCNMKL